MFDRLRAFGPVAYFLAITGSLICTCAFASPLFQVRVSPLGGISHTWALPLWIEVDTTRQLLIVKRGSREVRSYAVSTSARGVGEELDSLKTPRGLHRIAEKIGRGELPGTIFKSRKSVGRQWSRASSNPAGDFILSRILTLEGLQEGINRGSNKEHRCVDSRRRCIYIHGTHEESKVGTPSSHGCIRMRNIDVIELFELIPLGTQLWIS